MSTNFKVDRLLQINAPGIPDDWFTHVELPKDGVAVIKYGADIIQFDLRGAPLGYQIKHRILPAGRQLEFAKTGVGSYLLELKGVQPESATEAVNVISEISSFPDYPIWPTLETEAPQTVTESHSENVAPDLDALKAAAKMLHGTLVQFMERLAERESLHSALQIALVRDHISYAHHATHDIVLKHPGGNSDLTTLTIQQRIDYCHAMMLAPADVTDISGTSDAERERTAAEIFNNLPHTGKDLNDPPISARAWVDPRTGKRVKIADIEKLSVGTASFTPVGETEAITGLGLDLIGTQSIDTESPLTFLDPRGTWIDTISS